MFTMSAKLQKIFYTRNDTFIHIFLILGPTIGYSTNSSNSFLFITCQILSYK